MNKLNSYLNRITMYRLTLYVLLTYTFVAIALSFFGVLSYDPTDIALQTLYLLTLCYLVNKLFAKLFNAITNTESSFISALILSQIVGPIGFTQNLVFLTFVGSFAMASKYLLAFRKRHIFNPAAVTVVLSALILQNGASWWIGHKYMFFPVLIGGFLILKKINKFTSAVSFLIPYLFYIAYLSSGIPNFLFQSAAIYFASIMLIEPLTSPDKKRNQIAYGVLTAIFFAVFNEAGIYYAMGLALVTANVFNYVVTKPFRVIMKLKRKKEIARNIYSFFFTPKTDFNFIPGQFMHWTLPHDKPDSRGIRRYFTIASSPTEDRVTIAVKVPNDHSSYKQALKDLDEGGEIEAMDLSGEFVLPDDNDIPLCFIAGGIGVTPYRSMVKWLVDKKQKRDIILLYSVTTEDEICFKGLFDKAKRVGLKTRYLITEQDGYMNKKMIKKMVPDHRERTFYISGPQPMVSAFEGIVNDIGAKEIKTDFFPGYTEKHQG